MRKFKGNLLNTSYIFIIVAKLLSKSKFWQANNIQLSNFVLICKLQKFQNCKKNQKIFFGKKNLIPIPSNPVPKKVGIPGLIGNGISREIPVPFPNTRKPKFQ